jgi:chromosome segregation ATPase
MSNKPPSRAKIESRNNGFVNGLKTEWNLFWETILGDEESDPSTSKSEIKDPFVTGKLESLSLEQIKAITKALSSDRKILNQRIEALNKEVEENTAKLESLRLVSGEQDETLQSINELTDLGQSLSEQLHRINERLKLARAREDAVKKAQRDL